MTLEDLAFWVERNLELLYKKCSGGKAMIQCQVDSMWKNSQSVEPKDKLNTQDQVRQHFKAGETVLVDVMAMPCGGPYDPYAQPPMSEEELDQLRKELRFGLSDRVVCDCGPRWLSGHIVGTAVQNDGDVLPYLVKTDPLPGLPSSTISVPEDDDVICVQEVCFDPTLQLHLVKAAAGQVPVESNKKLRFAVGDQVVCRTRNNPQDSLEEWIPGTISEIWPQLPGEQKWDMGEVEGTFPDSVPYKIEHASGWMYCHRDDYTLIRRDGMQPLTRVRGISKRLEVRTCDDGSKEHIDHVTERRKKFLNVEESSGSDSDSE
jgi:hypothetical protein